MSTKKQTVALNPHEPKTLEFYKHSAHQLFKNIKKEKLISSFPSLLKDHLQLLKDPPYAKISIRNTIKLKDCLNAIAYKYGYYNWTNMKKHFNPSARSITLKSWTGTDFPYRKITFYEYVSSNDALELVEFLTLQCFDSDKLTREDFVGLGDEETNRQLNKTENIELGIWLKFPLISPNNLIHYNVIKLNSSFDGKYRYLENQGNTNGPWKPTHIKGRGSREFYISKKKRVG